MRLPLLILLAAALSAVEEGPFPVLKVVDGDTIEVLYSPHPERSSVEPKPTRVRLLYVDTPEASDNDHGKAMPEGKAAKAFLAEQFGEGASVYLWAPDKALKRDRFDRLLAVIYQEPPHPPDPGTETDVTKIMIHAPRVCLNVKIVQAGWSPYWTKYGDAPKDIESGFVFGQNNAKIEKAGAWATAPKWMADKANERTAPKK